MLRLEIIIFISQDSQYIMSCWDEDYNFFALDFKRDLFGLIHVKQFEI